jgi:D-apionolactonase
MTDSIWQPGTIPARAIRYGVDAPLPERRLLRAGPLSAILERGDLRHVKLGDETIVLRLYGAIRDRNWDTIEPVFTSFDAEADGEAFSIRFTAENVSADVDFAWTGQIVGTSAGVIVAEFDGVARKPFLRNRIGWCVLHPMSVAGFPATVETPAGRIDGAFPELISPHQPFVDMRSITHPTTNGGEVTIRFEGDLFEMEDQRNWTDASFKTYSTPLRLPYPVQLQAGDRVRQTVTIETRAAADLPTPAPSDAPVRVGIGDGPVGAVPPVGLGATSHGAPLNERESELLRGMRFAHLRLPLDLTDADWRTRLATVAADAAAIGAALELELQVGPDGDGLNDLFEVLAAGGAPLARALIFPAGELTTTGAVLSAAVAARDAAGLNVPIGGGSRAFFTEFNRARQTLPLAAMEVAGWPIDPEVHATDNASIMETLAAQPVTVETGRAIYGAGPIAVGPITLKMPFNPNATGPEPKPAPGELPANVDRRQPSLFCAAWTAGSLGRLATAGTAALTYFETTGWRGIIERSDHPLRIAAFHSWPGMVFPVAHVLAVAAAMAGAEALPIASADPLAVDGFAARRDGRIVAMIANLRDEPSHVRLVLPIAGDARMRRLDETTFTAACAEPEQFRDTSELLAFAGEEADLVLLPYATAIIDGPAA